MPLQIPTQDPDWLERAAHKPSNGANGHLPGHAGAAVAGPSSGQRRRESASSEVDDAAAAAAAAAAVSLPSDDFDDKVRSATKLHTQVMKW